jgi:hypothetical protein
VLTHDDRRVVEPELAARSDAVITGDELVRAVNRANDQRYEQPAQRDRLRQRIDVLDVELTHVLTHADLVERQS